MRWRRGVRFSSGVFLAAAVVVVALQVHVGGSGDPRRSCGSPLDVIVDRAGWDTWYTQDTVDPVSPGLLRTLRCPDAVNTRTWIAGVLAAIGFLAIILTRRTHRSDHQTDTARSLARLGRSVALGGITLTVGGFIALGFVVADREAPLFTFVARPTVLMLGLVALTPVLALVVVGRALVIMSRHLTTVEHHRETP